MPKFLFVAVIGMALYFSYAISLHGGLGGFVAGVFIGVTSNPAVHILLFLWHQIKWW